MSDLQQNRRLEANSSSERYDSMADGRSSVTKRTCRVMPASCSPSPRPSPLGRGRVLGYLSANATAVIAIFGIERLEPPARCSRSPWERVRVRGIRLPIQTRIPRLAGIVALCQSSFRTGGAL